jgi:hypothetical protein
MWHASLAAPKRGRVYHKVELPVGYVSGGASLKFGVVLVSARTPAVAVFVAVTVAGTPGIVPAMLAVWAYADAPAKIMTVATHSIPIRMSVLPDMLWLLTN